MPHLARATCVVARMRVRGISLLSSLAILLAGCQGYPPTARSWDENGFSTNSRASSPLIELNYAAAEVLISNAAPRLDPAHPIIVSTVVNIDTLETSTTLGRLISEHVSGRFTKSGLRMIEMKLQSSVYMKRTEGELMLSRQFLDIANAHRAQAVIVGTYGIAQQQVYVNLKLVQPEHNVVLAAHDYTIPMSADVKSLVRVPGGKAGW